MITLPQDYASLLYMVQDPNRPHKIIRLPSDEEIYEVDLNTRIIKTPQFLSVQQDHRSEWIYFQCARYYDGVDLSTQTCIVQYNNANPYPKKRGYIYCVPFIDIETLKDEEKIIIPWLIEGPITAYSGKVEFAFKFYSMNSSGRYNFALNTLPATSQILTGMDIFKESENYIYDPDTIEDIYDKIAKIEQHDLYWIKLE